MAEGLSDRGIAERLTVSLHTVYTHAQHVFAKLDLPATSSTIAASGRSSPTSRLAKGDGRSARSFTGHHEAGTPSALFGSQKARPGRRAVLQQSGRLQGLAGWAGPCFVRIHHRMGGVFAGVRATLENHPRLSST